jgi:hypothetical protein
MRIFVIAIMTAFLGVTVASSFSSEAYAARRGTMSGYDHTYGSHKGHKCAGGHCTPFKKPAKRK